MCKGYAILANEKRVYGGGSSHSDLANNLGISEDDYLKVNVIFNNTQKEGYRVEIDNHGEGQMDTYISLALVTKDGAMIPPVSKRIKEHIRKHKINIFKTLCLNLQSAIIKGDQTNYSATITGHQINSQSIIGGHQTNYHTLISIDQINGCVKINGCQNNNGATIRGNQTNGFTIINGCQNNFAATIEGDIILYNTIIGNKKTETSKLISEFSESYKPSCKAHSEATLTNFIKWIIKKNKRLNRRR
jgi:hypothetical protein